MLEHDKFYQLEGEGVGVLDKFHDEMENLLLTKMRDAIRTHRTDAQKHRDEMQKDGILKQQVNRHEHAIRRNEAMAEGIEKLLEEIGVKNLIKEIDHGN